MQYCKQIMISSSIHLPQLPRTISQPIIEHLGICVSPATNSALRFTVILVLYYGGFQMALVVQNWPTSAGGVRDACLILGWEDPLEKEMATHSSTLTREIPETEELGGLQSMGSQKSRTQLSDFTHSLTHSNSIYTTISQISSFNNLMILFQHNCHCCLVAKSCLTLL